MPEVNPETSGDPRLAGSVKRWHTLQTLNNQDIAQHSWNVGRLLLAIWPDAPRHVIIEAYFHDLGEQETGDPPSTLKKRNPTLREMYKVMENEARNKMVLPWGVPPRAGLSPEETQVLKLADLIEMYEYASNEMLLGNQFMRPVCLRLKEWLLANVDLLVNDEIQERATRYIVKRFTWLTEEPE